MKFGEFCLTAAAIILASVALTTIGAFLAWVYEDWKKNRRDW